MPPSAGPRHYARDPAEEATLKEYRRQIAEILQQKSNSREIKQALLDKKLAYHLERQKRYGKLNALLNGRTIGEIARRAGMKGKTHATVSRVLLGQQEPKITMFLRLQRALGIGAGEFYVYLQDVWRNPIRPMCSSYLVQQIKIKDQRTNQRRLARLTAAGAAQQQEALAA